MSLEEGLAHFGLATLNYLPANESLIFSPLSIILALGVISAGLDGPTKIEFNQAFTKATSSSLEFPFTLPKFDEVEEQCEIRIRQSDNSSSLRCIKPFLLVPRNPESQMSFYTFILSDSLLKNTFISEIYKHYEAEAMVLDLRDTAGVLEIVNQRVDKITGGKFKLSSDVLGDPTSAATVVNFVHFKGSWNRRFTADGKRKFYLGNGEHKELLFMDQTGYFDYLMTDEFSLVSIPYTDGFKFVALLPNQNLSLEDCLTNLSTKELLRKMKSMVSAGRVHVKMPKFRINTNIDLKEMLGKFGIYGIFTGSANFSRMTTDNVYIGRGKHSAKINLDESGTEAVGITRFDYKRIKLTIYNDDPPVIELNRPFAFFITVKNHIIFMGKMHG